MPLKEVRGKLVVLIVAAVFTQFCQGSTDACYGGDVVLKPEGSVWRSQLWYGISAEFGGKLPEAEPPLAELVPSTPANACATLEGNSIRGRIVLAMQGHCSFVEKARNAEAAGAAAIVVYSNTTGCFRIAANKSAKEQAISIPVASISQQAGLHFLSLHGRHAGVSISLFRPSPRLWDPPSSVLLILIALATLAAAGCWVGHEQRQRLPKVNDSGPATPSQEALLSEERQTVGSPVRDAPAGSTSCMEVLVYIAVFVGISSAFLLIGMFLGGNKITSVLLVGYFSLLLVGFMVIVLHDLMGLVGCSPLLARLVSVPCGLAVVVAWLLLDVDTWGWVFQDLMGVAYIVLMLRLVLFPNLKVLCIVMPAAVIYDVFWVFLQPLMTGGTSVMVKVASQVSVAGKSLPVVLQVPGYFGPPYSTNMLGFGDILLPGFLLMFARSCDVVSKEDAGPGYFWPLLACYGAGLVLTNLVLVLSQAAQPALLYLVPCTLLPFLFMAWRRGEVRRWWLGLECLLAQQGSVVGSIHGAEAGELVEARGSNCSSPGDVEQHLETSVH